MGLDPRPSAWQAATGCNRVQPRAAERRAFQGERRSAESWRCTAKRSKCTLMLATRLQVEA